MKIGIENTKTLEFFGVVISDTLVMLGVTKCRIKDCNIAKSDNFIEFNLNLLAN